MTRYFIFGTASLSFLLMTVNFSAISVAFPNITSNFNVSLVLAGWVLSINSFTASVCMPLGGKAGDIFGLKKAYLFSLIVFIAGSLICALAPNIFLLILGRFLQAIGHGMILPLSVAIVGEAFSKSRQQAIGFFGSLSPIGNIIGPIIGGWMVESFGWRSIFWFNIPFCLTMLLVSLKLFKAVKGEERQMDLLGTGYFTGALFSFLVALSALGNVQSGGSWVVTGVILVTAIAFLVAFIRREGRIKDPIIEPIFFKQRPFLAANIYSMVFGATALGVMNFVPLFVTSVYGMTTIVSGLILTPRAVGTVLAAMMTSYFLPRWGYRWPLLIGTGIVIISIILLGLELPRLDILGIHFSAAFLIGFFLFLSGAGMGILAPAASNACLDLMPGRIGTITGLRGMFRHMGGTVSITLTTLVLNQFSDISVSFKAVFFGLALILLVTIPTIFMMPKSPDDQCWTKPASLA